jgi:hypothetical protein
MGRSEADTQMKSLVYLFLFVAAAALVLGFVLGLAFKLISLIVFGALIVAGILFVARLMRGSSSSP